MQYSNPLALRSNNSQIITTRANVNSDVNLHAKFHANLSINIRTFNRISFFTYFVTNILRLR